MPFSMERPDAVTLGKGCHRRGVIQAHTGTQRIQAHTGDTR